MTITKQRIIAVVSNKVKLEIEVSLQRLPFPNIFSPFQAATGGNISKNKLQNYLTSSLFDTESSPMVTLVTTSTERQHQMQHGTTLNLVILSGFVVVPTKWSKILTPILNPSPKYASTHICLPEKMSRCCCGGMPSFSSTRSLIRSTLSVGSMSISISFPVRVCGKIPRKISSIPPEPDAPRTYLHFDQHFGEIGSCDADENRIFPLQNFKVFAELYLVLPSATMTLGSRFDSCSPAAADSLWDCCCAIKLRVDWGICRLGRQHRVLCDDKTVAIKLI